MTYTKLIPNVSPYWDDYEKRRNFLRIIFRPGRAVQARELTQLQTILQNQIESFANHIFKDGSSVIGANVKLTDQASFIEIPAIEVVQKGTATTISNVQDLVGHHIQAWTSDVNTPSGTLAEILAVDNNAGTLRLQLIYRGGKFAINDKFVSIDYENGDVTIPPVYYQSDDPNHITAIGEGMRALIEPGIVYVNGFFVQIPTTQEIFVSKSGTTGTFVIGYKFNEVTLEYVNEIELDPIDNVTFLGETTKDPASGASNFGAPGADRYIMKLILTSYNVTDPLNILDKDGINIGSSLPLDFYQTIKVTDGIIETRVEKPQYADIIDLLAGRTYDESGSYTVEPFTCIPKKLDANNINYEIGNGRAYVLGYEREIISPVKVAASKTRTFRTKTAQEHTAKYGTYIMRRTAPPATTFNGSSASIVSVANDTILLPEHPYGLGDKLNYFKDTGTAIGGLTDLTDYYVIPVSKDLIALATSKANATAETKINITAVGTGTNHSFTPTSITMQESFDPTSLQIGYLKSGYGGSGRLIGQVRVYFMNDFNDKTRLYVGDNKRILTDLQEAKSISSVTGDPSATDTFMDIASWSNTQAIGFNQPILELTGKYPKQISSVNYATLIKFGNKSITIGVGYSLATGDPNDTFQGGSSPENAIAVIYNTSTGIVVDHNSGTIDVFGITPTGGGTATITASADHDLATGNYDFYMLIDRVSASVRTKTLTAGATFDINVGAGTISSITLNGTNNSGTLTTAAPSNFDVSVIESIIRDPAGVAEDVTNLFFLNDGQKDLFYDYSKITGTFTASQIYRVKLHYWAWGISGDFFATNSYAKGTDTYYDDKGGFESHIPLFTNENKTKTYNLRDCLDFRRNVTEISSAREILEPMSTVQVSYEYYLPRWDKIWIDKLGNIGVTEGIAEELPRLPPEKSGTMSLYNIHLNPFIYDPEGTDVVITPDQVSINTIDRKNYTMEDIRKLDRRIKNLETYTSENQLELDSYADTVLDKDGLTRAKSGIFVDKFVDHSKGFVFDPGYRCSMEPSAGGLHGPFEMNHVSFEYDSTPAASGVQTNVSEATLPWEHTISLNYTPVNYIEQPLASETININPFNVIVWAGEITMNPLSDTWVETRYVPAMQISDPDEAAKIMALYINPDAGIPVWGAWSSRVIGVSEDSTLRRDEDGGGSIRNTTTTSTIKTTRTGTILEESGTLTVTKDMGERIVDVSSIPWMRPIDIDFTASGMKPDTNINAFFSDVDVSPSITWNVINPFGKTNVSGDISGTFHVPEKSFFTGTNILTLKDSVNNSNTIASGEFIASGTLYTKQLSILSVEVPTYTTRTLNESSISFSKKVTKDNIPRISVDPIAQTFLINEKGGVFLESVDIFFASKDRYIPVTLMIVETLAGVPGPNRVPFALIRKLPSDIDATYWDDNQAAGSKLRYRGTHYAADNTTVVHVDGSVVTGSPTDFKATNFKFSDPIYLKEGTEYAFILISNSDNYNVYISRMGQKNIITNATIDKQPHLGSLLASQNISTWTPDQYADIKFKLNRCDFDSSPSALYLRVKGTHEYWADIAYDVGDEVIFNHSTDGLLVYQNIISTLAASGNNPQTSPTKWLAVSKGYYDATLLNISMDNLVIPGTEIINQWLSDPDTTWLNFANKNNIEIATKDTIELYKDNKPQNPTSPYVINLKLQLQTDSTWHSPIINKNRTFAVLINNLVKTPEADAPIPLPTWDSGEYISDTVYLKENAIHLKMLIDVQKPNDNAIIVPKYRTIKEDLRYVARDSILAVDENLFGLQDLKDEFAYVYHIDSNLTSTVTSITQKGSVIIDGLDIENNRVYLSSIEEPGNFVNKTTLGLTNPWIIITTEPDILLSEISVWTGASVNAGNYVIEPGDRNIYIANVTTTALPSINSLDWTLIPAVFVNNTIVDDIDVEWRPMEQVGIVKETVDTTRYVEYEYVPLISPSEEFDNFAIKIEMYSNDEVHVPSCRRLRVIATI